MGEDKDENDLLIRYGFPEDIWCVTEGGFPISKAARDEQLLCPPHPPYPCFAPSFHCHYQVRTFH